MLNSSPQHFHGSPATFFSCGAKNRHVSISGSCSPELLRYSFTSVRALSNPGSHMYFVTKFRIFFGDRHFTTKMRRAKLRMLREGLAAWARLDPEQRKIQDRWKWITERALRMWKRQNPTVESITIEPSWAERVLGGEALE